MSTPTDWMARATEAAARKLMEKYYNSWEALPDRKKKYWLEHGAELVEVVEPVIRSQVYDELLQMATRLAENGEVTAAADIRWAVARSLSDLERRAESTTTEEST